MFFQAQQFAHDEAIALVKKNCQRVTQFNDFEKKATIPSTFKERTAFLFQIYEETKPALAHLESKLMLSTSENSAAQLKEEAKTIIANYKSAMNMSIDNETKAKEKRPVKTLAQFREELFDCAMHNKRAKMKDLLDNYTAPFRYKELIKVIDYAYRNAAARGSVSVMELLYTHGANAASKGPISGRIALHAAIEKGESEAVEFLLNHETVHGYYIEPAKQLLFKDKAGLRPIDLLDSLANEKKEEMSRIIKNAIDFYDDVPVNNLVIAKLEEIGLLKQSKACLN